MASAGIIQCPVVSAYQELPRGVKKPAWRKIKLQGNMLTSIDICPHLALMTNNKCGRRQSVMIAALEADTGPSIF